MRGNPDVAYNADPNSGFAVCDSLDFGTMTPWISVGGTSAGAPQWAALVAIVNQGRAQVGQTSLDGRSQTLPMIYGLPASDFHDITTGSNTGFTAGTGYDLVSGLGSPFANRVVADLTPAGVTVASPDSTLAAINYGNGENVFHVGSDMNLHVDHFDGTNWTWGNLGNPMPTLPQLPSLHYAVRFTSGPVAINQGLDTALRENVFLTAADGNLYCAHYDPTNGSWYWINMGNPGGVQFMSDPVAINYGSGSSQRENVFLTGAGGILYCDHYDPTNGNWTWVNLGNPMPTLPQLPSLHYAVPFASNPVAINQGLDTALRENVFLMGADGKLYCDHYDPTNSSWYWLNMGNPGGSLLAGDPTAINYGSGSSQRENVFVRGADGNLYCDHYDPTNVSWTWVNMSNPGGVRFVSNPTAINYGADTALGENVFLTGADGKLYCDHYDPTSGNWTWVNLGNPGAVQFVGDPVAINYGSGTTARENVFVMGADGILYCEHYDPTNGSWYWLNMGHE
jgi:hypothetical protein